MHIKKTEFLLFNEFIYLMEIRESENNSCFRYVLLDLDMFFSITSTIFDTNYLD